MPTSADALAAVNTFNSTRKTSAQAQAEAEAKYGVSDLASRVSSLRSLTSNLTDAVEGVDSSVTGRTSGTFTNEAQRSALVNRERQPILGELSKTSNNLNLAQGDLTGAQSMAGQMASSIISDENSRYQSLLDQYNANVAEEQRRAESERWMQEFQYKREQDKKAYELRMQEYALQRQAAKSNLSTILAQITESNAARAAATTTAPAAPSAQDQRDYNFVKNLIAQVNSGDGTLVGTVLGQARSGNERSKNLMRQFYSLQGRDIPANFRSFL